MAKKEAKKKEEEPPTHGWVFYTILVIVLLFVSIIIAGVIAVVLMATDVDQGTIRKGTGNAALITVDGVITVGSPSPMFADTGASATQIVDFIQTAAEDKSIVAIVIEINSPGGSPVASDEIGQALKDSGKPTVAYIREVGASGGYWVASAADYIFANRMSMTGSIGVIGAYPSFENILSKYNITYNRIVSGKYKDMGSPLKELQNDERQLIMQTVNQIHNMFVEEVANNRNLPLSQVQKLATGQVYTGAEAVELKLIDAIGGQKEAKEYLEETLNKDIELSKYERRSNLFELFAASMQDNFFSIGRGIGSSITEQKNSQTALQVWT